MKLIIFTIILSLTSLSYSEDIVLHVNAKYIKHLGVPEGVGCSSSGESEESEEEIICWQFYSWHLYQGKVKRVISGEYKESRITFVISQHSPIVRSYSKNMYIKVSEFEKKEWAEFAGTNLYAKDFGFVESVVCFDTEIGDSFEKAIYYKNEDEVCYDEDDL